VKNHLYKWLPFLIIIFIATALRFYQLGNVPIELNRDEASLGYTAYSLLQTGKEEHGIYWPINIESFGDWKLPAYVYTLIPFVKTFGLHSWVIKLPSALAGVGIVILSAVITWLLTNSWKDKNKRITLSTLVTFMIAISPWNIHMSHMAYEANLGMLFLMSGVALLLTALQNKKKRIFLIPSTLLLGLTFFSYHSYQIFMPLLVLSFIFIYWKEVKSIFETEKKISFVSIAIGALFTIALITTSLNANQTKLSGLSIFDKSSYSLVMKENRRYFENRNSILAKIHSNNFYFIFNQAQHNIADIFSSKFLFFEGGSHGSHDIPGTGKMHPVAFIFLMIAGYKFLTVWQEKKLEKWHKIIIAWLVVSIVAPFITFEAAHTIRFSPALFSLEFLSAYGLFILLEKSLKNNKYKIVTGLTIFILLYSFVSFFATYFFVAPKRDIDSHNWQIEKLIELVNEKSYKYDLISMPGSGWSPYIYFLLFNQTDPNTLNEDLEFYESDHEGFRHVKRLGNIHFNLIDWNDESGQSVLYVIKSKEVPGDKLESEKYKLEYSLTNPYAKHEWLLLGRK
jgi:4-amino-4-deoxy-L-arabinose transferase-like glycosyltransferase